MNVALLLPPGTVTLAGTLADDELSLNDTTTPPLGAGPLNVTVPTEAVPPVTVLGFSESELNATGLVPDTTYCTLTLETVEPARIFKP